jgi:hypothetical protein
MATVYGARTVVALKITAFVGDTTCSAKQDNVNASLTFDDGSYFVDIQGVPGCATPGPTVRFKTGSDGSLPYRAKQTGTIPSIPGTPVHLDLDFSLPATATDAPTTSASAATP